MLAKQQYPAVLFAAAFVSGSLINQVQGVQFPTCITSCVRQNGCAPTDADCMCKKASGGSFLSDVVVCMNQWCPTSTTFGDLIDPIKSNCDVPEKAIQEAESKAGFDTGSSSSGGDDGDDSSSSVTSTTKASPTAGSKGDSSTTTIASVGLPTKVDSTTAPAPTSTGAAAQVTASSFGSVILSGTTAVGANTASESLLVASTTLTSTAAAPTTTGGSTSDDSDDSSSGTSSGGSPADGAPAGENAATTGKASLLAAVLAVAASMVFGW
ncbi:hypothetical protein Hte_005402 [Hypoxylon texense]